MRFLDTNILVYAALNQDPRKHRLAALLVKDALQMNDGAISAQVISEYTNILIKKTKRRPDEIRKLVEIFSPLNKMDMTAAMPAEVASLPRLLCHRVTLLRQKLITL